MVWAGTGTEGLETALCRWFGSPASAVIEAA
ncbi:hypothetical protein [Actinophytocola sp.]